MVTVTPILGSYDVKAPVRNFGFLRGRIKIVCIVDPHIINDIPDLVRVFLHGQELRTIFDPLDLVPVRKRILNECPGYRFAYKGDIADVVQRVVGKESLYEILDRDDHPHDLIGLPPESFVVV